MKLLRKILFPFSILYGFITSIRNFLFDKGILKSYSFDIPIIAVGNLSVGGTGKTPQIEYLIRLLSPKYKIATLSRGYKRKSEGFALANSASTAEILGDEPFQIHLKFPQIQVAVDTDRRNGIENLLSQKEKTEIILLDDAYQHRKVKAGFYILLTAYDDLFCDDFMLPTGNLRENSDGVKRADVLIVTKCPENLQENLQKEIMKKLGPFLDCARNGKVVPVFFSFIDYDDKVYNKTESKTVSEIKNVTKLLVVGIAKPEPFFNFLEQEDDEKLVFPDHHHFMKKDILEIENKAQNKLIITTEKDYVRLKNSNLKSLFYLPIKSSFISESDTFDQTILNYVGASTRNS